MGEQEIISEINRLKKHIPKIKSEQTKMQQRKYMHRLMKEIAVYRGYRNET